MKNSVRFSLSGVPLFALILFTGCYTQVATYDRVSVMNREANPSYADTASTDTVFHEHYWADPWYDPWYGYPFSYRSGFYVGLSFSVGDPFWSPWCYRPYDPWSRRYWHPGWAWYDPFWYDPFWYTPYSYYGGYYAGYGYPSWWWYGPYIIYDDAIPRKKRDWERRGADLADRTIERPSGSAQDLGPLVQSTSAPPPAAAGAAAPRVRQVEPKKDDTRRVEQRAETKTEIRPSGKREVRSAKSTPVRSTIAPSRPSVSRSFGNHSSGRSRSSPSHTSGRARSRSGK